MKIKAKSKLKQFKIKDKLKRFKNTYDNEDTPLISKQKEIFNKLVDERLEKIADLDEKVNSDNLICRYKGNTADAKFDKFDSALSFLNKIRGSKISLTDAKCDQNDFKLDLGHIKKGNKKIKRAEILLNEIRQIVYSLYKSKEIIKKVYSNIIKSILL